MKPRLKLFPNVASHAVSDRFLDSVQAIVNTPRLVKQEPTNLADVDESRAIVLDTIFPKVVRNKILLDSYRGSTDDGIADSNNGGRGMT